jgi:cytoplasmic tRNA 2-thiolation protein 2
MSMINHKFRSNLRAQCKIRHEDFLLVCVSGGNNSMAMLQWFYSTLKENASKKKMFFKIKVLFIDDSILLISNNKFDMDSVISERNRKREFIINLCKNYGFDCDIINLENSASLPIFNRDDIIINDIQIENDIINRFINLFKLIPKLSSFQEDFIKIMTRNLIFNYAIKNNFNKIVLANTAQVIVNNIFSTIVKGRGFALREDTGYIDNHYLNGKITILRPLKDYLTKEILLFNYINKVEIQYSSIDILVNNSNGNTNFLLKNFFDKLQDRMGSTITTVLGTADKLKLKEISNNNLLICGFCLNYLDQVYNELEIGSIDTIVNE